MYIIHLLLFFRIRIVIGEKIVESIVAAIAKELIWTEIGDSIGEVSKQHYYHFFRESSFLLIAYTYIFSESGISHDPCSDVYCGPSPFSEIEVCITSILLIYTFNMFEILLLSNFFKVTKYQSLCWSNESQTSSWTLYA